VLTWVLIDGIILHPEMSHSLRNQSHSYIWNFAFLDIGDTIKN